MPRKKNREKTTKAEKTQESRPQAARPDVPQPERMKTVPLIAHCKAMLEIYAGRVVDAIVARRRAFSASEEYGRRMGAFVRFAPSSYYRTLPHKMVEPQYGSFVDSWASWELGKKLTLQAAESQVVLRGVAAAFVQAYRETETRLGKLVAYKVLRLLDTEARSQGKFDPPEWPDFLAWNRVARGRAHLHQEVHRAERAVSKCGEGVVTCWPRWWGTSFTWRSRSRGKLSARQGPHGSPLPARHGAVILRACSEGASKDAVV